MTVAASCNCLFVVSTYSFTGPVVTTSVPDPTYGQGQGQGQPSVSNEILEAAVGDPVGLDRR